MGKRPHKIAIELGSNGNYVVFARGKKPIVLMTSGLLDGPEMYVYLETDKPKPDRTYGAVAKLKGKFRRVAWKRYTPEAAKDAAAERIVTLTTKYGVREALSEAVDIVSIVLKQQGGLTNLDNNVVYNLTGTIERWRGLLK